MVQDTQFYMWFAQNHLGVEITPNPDEFDNYQWLTVDKALELYKKEQLPLFVPQVNILTQLLLQNLTFNQLKQRASEWQVNPLNYLTNKGHFILFNEIKDQNVQLHKFLDDCDFKNDKEREKELAVWTDEGFIAAQPSLSVFS